MSRSAWRHISLLSIMRYFHAAATFHVFPVAELPFRDPLRRTKEGLVGCLCVSSANDPVLIELTLP